MEFRFDARNQTGKLTRSVIEAKDETAAFKLLRERGLIVLKLRGASAAGLGNIFVRSVGLRDRMLLTQELALMVRSGIPLARAISDLEDQTANRTLRGILRKIATDIRGGTAFSDALRKHPRAFPPLMTAMIRSGEASGKLVEVLERLSIQMEKDAALHSRLISALIYPTILTVGIIGVMILVVFFVVPQLEKIFTDANIELPLMTRVLLATAAALRSFGLMIAVGLVLIGVAGWFAFRFLPTVRQWLDKWKLRLPLFGALAQKISLARFAGTGATLLAAGLPLIETLRISQAVLENRYYEAELTRVAGAAEAGRGLAETIRSGQILPPMVANLIAVGEESGSLDRTFATVATFYEREVDATTRNLTSLLEPALMVLMGVAIGFLVAAVLMPIYKLVQAL